MTNNTNMHRIAVVVTTSGEALRACDREDPFSRRRPQLERREHGVGTTIPHPCCPVWEVVK